MNAIFEKTNCVNVIISKLLVYNDSSFNVSKIKLFTINI